MPVARFQLPDGKVARFEVPEGTTPEQAEALILKQFPNLVPKAERTIPEELVRQAGLTLRAGAQGVTAIPNMVGDALGLRSSEAVRGALTRIGLPEPEGSTERVAGNVAGAMAGQGGFMKLGQLMTHAASPLAMRIGEVLTSRPVAQLVGATGAAGAAGATREAGGGPVAQTVAGLVGGLVAPIAGDVALTGTKSMGRAVGAALAPRNKVVGTFLRDAASDPRAAIRNMADNADELVPGSTPTAAQASADPGLLKAERGAQSAIKGVAENLYNRQIQNNAARLKELDRLRGGEGGAAAGAEKRGVVTGPMREEALDSANIVGVSTEKLLRQIRGVESQPGIRASDVISKSLAEIKDKVAAFTNDDGFINAKDLYTIRKELGSLIQKNAQETKNWDTRLTGGLQNQVQGYIDDAIEAAGGAGWKDYLSRYAQMSKPVEQMETIGKIKAGATNAEAIPVAPGSADTTQVLSQAKFRNLFDAKRAELAETLSPAQMKKLDLVMQDLDRGAMSATAAKVPGSPTMQNISTAYVLGQAFGGAAPESNLMRGLMTPVSAVLKRFRQEDLEKLFTEALLDPKLASSLMQQASPKRMESLALELSERARAYGIGAAQSTAGQIQRAEEPRK